MPTKPQRLLDLLAFLVGRRLPVSVEDIMEAVPAYAEDREDGDETAHASVRRKFERDKDELRELGIPLETVTYGPFEEEGYRLPRKDFYLPYLKLLREEGPGDAGAEAGRAEDGSSGHAGARSAPPSSDRRQRGAATVELEEDQARDAVDALRSAASLPSFPFVPEARSALRKLTFDLEGVEVPGTPILHVEPSARGDRRQALDALWGALEARKRVSFTYRGMYRGRTTERTVRPYGLLFQHGHWYLLGHDEDRDGLRLFRLGRMGGLEPNTSAPKTPDYRVPDDLSLDEWRDREPWDLAGGEEEERAEVRVLFRFPRSLWAERNGKGALDEDRGREGQVRRFEVRDPEPLLRWLLSLEGEASVLDPPELRDTLDDMAREVAARHRPSPGRAGG